MKKPAIPANEAERLSALYEYQILDSGFERKFNDLVLLAAQFCEVPIALISLIDEKRQWFKAAHGLAASETPREQAFCAHAILQDDLFVVADSKNDERFSDNPLVTGNPHIRFYAGAVLKTPNGHNIGTICAIDSLPREITAKQRAALQTISRQVIELFELRKYIQQNEKYVTELRETKHRFEEAERIAKIGSWEYDLSTGHLKWSKEQYRIFELEECTPESLYDSYRGKYHPEDISKLDSLLEQCRSRTNFSMEHRIVLKDGSVRYIGGQGEVIFNAEGNPIKLHGTGQDITEKKKLFEALEAQRAKVISSAKMASLGEMAGGIAHEINNPLTIIKSKASQLQKKVGNGEIDALKLAQDLKKIEQTVDRIAKIVNSMRVISRNADFDSKEEFKLIAAVSDALELCGEKFKHHNVQLFTEIPEDLVLEGRAVQISQVILNLLSNSYDAIAEQSGEKWIRIKAENSGSSIRITVSDCGDGIAPEIRENIMNPFFTTKEIGKGTGLGLSISHSIIQEHQGRIFYDTNAKNTTFVIELPKVQTRLQSVPKNRVS